MTPKKARKIAESGGQPAANESLDSRLKLLEFNLNTLCIWEEATGRKFETYTPTSLSDFRVLMWAALKIQIPDITVEQVGSMITMKNAPALQALMTEKTGIDSSTLER